MFINMMVLASHNWVILFLAIHLNSLEETALHPPECLELFLKELNFPIRFSKANLPTYKIKL